MSTNEILIKAEHVSKKFCRSLKRSLWYGTQDVTHSLMPWSKHAETSYNEIDSPDFKLPELRKDEFWAVKDVSFEVRRGECLGLIGHNGAGKSTLLKMLNSINRPDSGRITMRGRVGALIELSAGFNPILTGRENIYNQAALLGFSKKETNSKFDAIVDFSELEDFLDMPVQNYSSGMKVKLGFAVSSQMEPDILILDEVLAVGDVAFRFKCMNAMSETLKNAAVVFVSHTMPQIFRVASSIMVLEKGGALYHSTDVGGGIDQYYAITDRPEATVTGSGDAVIRACTTTVRNKTSLLGESISVGPDDSIKLELDIELKAAVKEARIQAVLWSQEMIPVMEIVTDKGIGYLARSTENDAIKIVVDIPPLHLNGGRYMLTINIVSEDYDFVYCRHDNAAIINVENSNFSGANCIIPAIWNQT